MIMHESHGAEKDKKKTVRGKRDKTKEVYKCAEKGKNKEQRGKNERKSIKAVRKGMKTGKKSGNEVKMKRK